MIDRLLSLFLSLFVLGVTPGEGEDDPADPDEAVAAAAEGEPGDDDAEPTDEDPISEALEATEGEEEAPPRRKKPAADDAEAIASRVAERVIERFTPPPAPSVDQDYQREEKYLETIRAGGNAKEIADAEWLVNSNRTIRNTNRRSELTEFMVRDQADKDDFRELAYGSEKDRKRYKKWGPLVESKLKELRAGGTNLPRRVLMRYMIGESIDGGEVVVKTKKAAASTPDNVVAIARGRSPTMRSDVSAKGKMSDREKREQRLLGKRL